MSSNWSTVMRSPPGTSGRYLDTGSSSAIDPESTSCNRAVPVIVFVFDPMRK
jgi:hypothetical protein